MLTNNFYQAMRAYMSGSTLGSVLKNSANSSVDCYPETPATSGNMLSIFASESVSTGSGGIAFGTGAVPPSRDDYWLSGDLISTISILARSGKSSFVDGSVRVSGDLTVKNTSNTDTIVINEMGFMAYVKTASNRGAYVLAARVVLDTPLTLGPGEQGVISHTLDWATAQ